MTTNKWIGNYRLAPILIFVMALGLNACGGGGGGSDDDETTTTTTTTTTPPASSTSINGGGVKGPLANAIVTVYAYDPSQPGFKGAVIATATTNAAAQIVGLSLPEPLTPPYLLEFTSDAGTTDITTGVAPVIATMRTVLTQALIDSSEPIYASPLTTMAVDIAIANSNAATTAAQFQAALTAAAAQIVSTLGFGMSGSIDIFATPPLVNDSTTSTAQQSAVAAYRTAVEALTTVIWEMQQQSSGDIQAVMTEMSMDLADGIIDGMIGGNPSSLYSDTTLDVLAQDPATMIIPNTSPPQTVAEVQAILIAETATTGSATSTTELGVGGSITTTTTPAQSNPDRDGDGTLNADDAFPNDPAEDTDTDGDGIGDNADPDANGNGILDEDEAIDTPPPIANDADLDGVVNDGTDNCPLVYNPLQRNTDGADDGGNACDADDDNDGEPDVSDAFPLIVGEQADADGDGIGNNADPDDDNDGRSDTAEDAAGASIDHDGDGKPNREDTDSDNDGVLDNIDFDPYNNAIKFNKAPVTSNSNLNTDEDVAVATPLNFSDDGVAPGGLVFNIVDAPTSGALSGTAPALTYTPNAETSGADSFSFTVTDGAGKKSNKSTVSISVAAVNDPPTANDDSATVAESGGLTINLRGNDGDVDDVLESLTLVLGAATNGTLTDNGDGSVNYQHDGSETSSDSFTYMLNDGEANSNVATVSITVTPVNDPPVANDDIATVAENAVVTIDLRGNDSDADDDIGTLVLILSAASNGTLTDNGDGTVDYQHDGSETTGDSFTYMLNDGDDASNTATVEITVTAVNDPPLANDDSATVAENAVVTIDLRGNDSDADNTIESLTLNLGTASNGTLTDNGDGTVDYQHDGSETLGDSFTYTLNDGTANSDPATVTITVTAVNDPPQATNDGATVAENAVVTIDLRGNDSDADNAIESLTLNLGTASNGSLTDNGDGTVDYQHDGSETVSDSFTYTLNDGEANSNMATVVITVTPVNDAPVANDDSASVLPDNIVLIAVLDNDSDAEGSILTPTFSSASEGTVTNNGDGRASFDATGLPAGTIATFTYTVNDGDADSNTATVTVTVTENETPVIDQSGPLPAVMIEDGSFTSPSVSASDTEGDPLSWSLGSAATFGVATVSGTGASPSIGYVPNQDYNGPDSFSVAVSDGTSSASIVISVTITPVNDAPTASNDSATVAENGVVNINLRGNDGDVDDAIEALLLSLGTATNGTLTDKGDGTVDYQHNGSETVSDSFTYTLSDGDLDSNTATVSITVTPVNDPPVANDDSATVLENASVTIDLRSNDSDVDDDLASLTLGLTAASNGTLTDNGDGTVNYQHDGSETSSDSFTYTLNDGDANSNIATVSITVTATNDPPIANDDSATVAENGVVTINLRGNDSDADDDLASSTLVLGMPTHGTLTDNGNGTVDYQHDGAEAASDSFTYRLNDGDADSDPATVTITVTPVNDPPVANDDSATVAEGALVTIDLRGNDSDADDSLASLILGLTTASNGTLTDNGDGTVDYQHDGSETSSDSFTYTLNDGDADSNSATVTITVTANNDPPIANDDSATVAENALVTIDLRGNDSDADDPIESLTLSLGTATSGTLFDNGDGTVDYQHDGSETASDSFTYTLNDGVEDSDPATVTITVTPVNDPPVANDDSATVAENALVTIDLRSNDSDVDDPLESLALSLGAAAYGTLSDNGDGTVDYQHDGSETSSDSFTYTLTDGDASSGPATVSIVVTPVNDDPVAVDDDVLVIQNTLTTTLNVLDNDIDVDGDLLMVVAGDPGATHGTVVNNGDGTFDYNPDTDYVGPDSFDYTVDDGNGGTDTGTVNITVAVSGTAVVSELLDPEIGGGIGRLEGTDNESVHKELTYEIEQYIPTTNTFFELEFLYDYNLGDFRIGSTDFDDDESVFVKADGSWVDENDVEFEVTTPSHPDGSMTISIIDANDAEVVGAFRVRAQTVDINGQPMTDHLDDVWASQLLDSGALFGEGAQQLSSYSFEPEFDSIEIETSFCSPPSPTDYDQRCVYTRDIIDETSLATTLDELVVDTPWVDPDDFTQNGLVRVEVTTSYDHNAVLFAELLSDNTVNYYVVDFTAGNAVDYITLALSVADGWERDSNIRNTDILRFVVPETLAAQFPRLNEDYDARRASFFVQNGYVNHGIFLFLVGDVDPGDGTELNGIAIDQVLANFDPPPTPDFYELVGTWVAELPSSNGDRRVLHIFDQGTFEQSGTCDFDGTTGMAYGTFYYTGEGLPIEWNDVTGEFGAFNFDSTFSDCDIGDHSNGATLLVDGDVLTHHKPGIGDIVYNRMRAAADPLVGSWVTGNIHNGGEGHGLLTFFDDGTFTISQNCEADGQLGFEYGSYLWDQGNTNALSGTLTIDTNGSCGVHDNNGFVFSGFTMFLDGNSLIISDGIDDIYFNRHSSPNLPCDFVTEWDDGLDEPAVFASFDQFEGVVNSCGGRLPLAAADFEGSSWIDSFDDGGVTVVETITFNNDGTATISETEDGAPVGNFVVNWDISNDYVILSNAGEFQDVWAITPSGIKVYTEEAGWSSTPDLNTLDGALEGEIWTGGYVNDANIAPIGNPDFAMINEDTTVTTGNVLANDTDLDSGPGALSITAFDAVSANNGTVSDNGNGSFNYTPEANFNGDDTFTYTVSDGAHTAIGTVTITVHSVNDPPEIQQSGPLAVVIDEDNTPLAFSLAPITAIDVDSANLVWSSTGASKGDANVSGIGPSPTITYVADTDANGADSFEVTVYDGDGGSDSITVNITINPVNDLPQILGTPQSFATDGVPYRFTPMGIDPDDQTKVYSIDSKPIWADFDTATGELSGTPAFSDVGPPFTGIVISLTTGGDTVSLPAFSITVNNTTGVGAVWNGFSWDDGSIWQ